MGNCSVENGGEVGQDVSPEHAHDNGAGTGGGDGERGADECAVRGAFVELTFWNSLTFDGAFAHVFAWCVLLFGSAVS
jgi:hypothetical protein